MADKYRNSYKRKKIDVIYNTMIYQIVVVTFLILFLIASKKCDNKLLNNFVKDIEIYFIETIDLSTFKSDIINKILNKSNTSPNTAKGGNPNKINFDKDLKTVSTPSNASLSPIILSMPIYSPISGQVTSQFGYRIHPITNNDDFHTGIDIAAPLGTDISSVLDGVVVDSGKSTINGNYIIIEHKTGFVTHYYHCSKILANVGTFVKRGERIAKVGSTGLSTGNHLHFEIKYNDISYDPMWLLKR